MTATPPSAPGRWPARYAPTCGSRAAAQHSSTLASTSAAPATPRKVWNWPAQLASAESSTVALDRTATVSSVAVPLARARRRQSAIDARTGAGS